MRVALDNGVEPLPWCPMRPPQPKMISCASRLMGTPCCSQMRQSRFISATDWTPLPPMRMPRGNSPHGRPFKNFLASLQRLQQALPAEHPPIRTALVTARSAPAHERVIRTLEPGTCASMNRYFWGLTKTEFLKAYRADVFFDDQQVHCNDAAGHVPTGHVPHGVANAD